MTDTYHIFHMSIVKKESRVSETSNILMTNSTGYSFQSLSNYYGLHTVYSGCELIHIAYIIRVTLKDIGPSTTLYGQYKD